MSEGFQRMSVKEIKEKMDAGWSPFVLDVRRPDEVAFVALDFADLHQPHGEVLEVIDSLPKDRDIVIHCKMGGRSAMAAKALAGAGFTRLINMEGGITAWANEIDTSLPTY